MIDWPAVNAALEPLETAAAIGLCGAAVTGLGLGLSWVKAHFKIAASSNAAVELANLNTVAQSAMQNAAGEVVQRIQAGKVDVSSVSSMRAAMVDAAVVAAAKIPDTIAKLSPAAGVLADMVEQKVALATAAPAASASVLTLAPADLAAVETHLSPASIAGIGAAVAAAVKPTV